MSFSVVDLDFTRTLTEGYLVGNALTKVKVDKAVGSTAQDPSSLEQLSGLRSVRFLLIRFFVHLLQNRT